ncbi:MAG: hypothetical protein IJV22_08055 [Bacteroidales bacterium]|nr:hypothetical protein [Bacteroidales bacterium]
MTLAISQSRLRTTLLDLLILEVMCLVPTFSHLLSIPLYQADPMRLLLLAGMLLVANRRNAYLLACALPLVSCLVSGMPTPTKVLIMVAELNVQVALFYQLRDLLSQRLSPRRRLSQMGVTVLSLCAATVGAKLVYYGLKALILSPAVVVSTPLGLQACMMLAAAVVFALFWSSDKNNA